MPSKVFISCGQTPKEKDVANDVASWLRSQGFNPYVAIEVQSILDINGGIIDELKSSDYYLFMNFRRERVLGHNGEFFRGSIYANQELSIAFTLGFDKMIFLNQTGTRREGMFAYIGSNTPEFDSYDEVLPVVKSAVQKARWDPDYSRNLVVANPHWSPPNVLYADHTGQRLIKALYIEIHNKRSDRGAIDTVIRLAHIIYPNRHRVLSPDRSHLKCSGSANLYSQIIWPQSQVSYDILALDMNNQSQVFLSSAMDVTPRRPMIAQTGNYVLEYEVFSQGFPPAGFSIELNLTGNHNSTSARLS